MLCIGEGGRPTAMGAAILAALVRGPCTCGEVEAATGLPGYLVRPGVSELEAAGLVVGTPLGYCCTSAATMARAA